MRRRLPRLRDRRRRDPAATGRRLLILLEGATVVAALTGDPAAGDDVRAIAATLL